MEGENAVAGEAGGIIAKEATAVLDKAVYAGGEKAVATDGARTAATDLTEEVPKGPAERAATDGVNRADEVPARTTTKDPIDIVSGEVVLWQEDVTLPGVLPLVLERTHVSSYRCGRWFGTSWASTLDQRLEVTATGAYYTSPDGMVLAYPAVTSEGSFPAAGPRLRLRRSADGAFELENPRTGRVLHFAARGGGEMPLRAVTDRNGNRIDVVYGPDGSPAEVVHSGGYRVGIEVAGGRITALRLGDGTILRRFGYDGAGRLAEVSGPSDAPLRFSYDAAGRLTGWADRNGYWYRYDYDDEGRGIHGYGSAGVLDSRLAYLDHETVVTDSLGHATRYVWNGCGRVVAETDPLGNTTTREWDEEGRLLTVTDPLGNTTRLTYDELGDITSVRRPDGAEVRAEFDARGLPLTVLDADGTIWRNTYDHRGNVTSEIDPTGAVTRYAYDRHGGLVSITDPLGAVTRMRCDEAGLPLAVMPPVGGVLRYGRDASGRVTSVTDAVGGVRLQTWTPDGLPRSRALPSGAVETWSYDAEGNPTHHTDPLGEVTETGYGPFDVAIARTGPDGTRLEFHYDTEQRLVGVTNAQGLYWRYDHDAAGRLTAETDFNGRTVQYSHDAAGRLVRRVNGAGQVTEYRRDALGNVVAMRSGGVEETFAYDRCGRLIRAGGPSAEVVLRRDALGNVVAETCAGRTITSAFDAAGRRTHRRTPSGAEARWEYDALGRPLSLRTGGQTIHFTRDAAGREIRRHLGPAAVLAQQWDADHRLTAQSLWNVAGPSRTRPRLLQHRAYAYRQDGNLVGIQDRLGERRFDTDRAGRVTSVDAAGWTERYAYDASGNLTRASWPEGLGDGETAGDRDYGGTLIRRAGNVHYEHDGQGRVVARRYRTLSGKQRVWRYEWDAADRLTGVTTPDGREWRYRYDAIGRRVAKLLLTADGEHLAERTDFCWDGSVLAEQIHTRYGADGPAARATTWTHDPQEFEPVTQVERAPVTERPQEWFDQRFYAIVTDQIGAPAELVDAAGNLTRADRRTLWGVDRPEGGGSTVPSCPLRFPGQYHDVETGLYYNYFRYYDPAVGRYHSPDPLGLAPQPNQYAYVRNPLNWQDPLGLAPYKGKKLSDPNPVPPAIRTEYEKIKAMRAEERTGVPSSLPRPTERIDPKTGFPQRFRASELIGRHKLRFRGAQEWDVPGTKHRILELDDGTLAYAKDHSYHTPKIFPGPWYPEGGDP